MARLSQSSAQAADNHRANKSGILKAHFGFGRMHIHIKRVGRYVDEESQSRMAVAGEKILIRAAHRAV